MDGLGDVRVVTRVREPDQPRHSSDGALESRQPLELASGGATSSAGFGELFLDPGVRFSRSHAARKRDLSRQKL